MGGAAQTVAIAATILIGGTQALQVALLGAMARGRGPFEAAWVSILGSLTGVSLALAARALVGERPLLPGPLASPLVAGAVALVAGAVLLFAVRGIPPAYATTGLLPVPYLIAASFLAPRLGVGLFLAAIVAGQLGGAVLLDHLGAFGAAPRPVDLARLLGIAALLAGVVLVRGLR